MEGCYVTQVLWVSIFLCLQKKCIAPIDDFLSFNMCKWQWLQPTWCSGWNSIRVIQGGMLTTKQHVRPIFYQTQCTFITHHIKAPTFFGHIVFLYCFTNIKLSTKIKNNLDNNHIKTYIHTLKFMTSKMHIAEISQSFPGQSYVCAIYLSDSK